MDRLWTVIELVRLIAARRKWMLLPPVLILLVVAGLLIVVEATPLSPFLYPLF